MRREKKSNTISSFSTLTFFHHILFFNHRALSVNILDECSRSSTRENADITLIYHVGRHALESVADNSPHLTWINSILVVFNNAIRILSSITIFTPSTLLVTDASLSIFSILSYSLQIFPSESVHNLPR